MQAFALFAFLCGLLMSPSTVGGKVHSIAAEQSPMLRRGYNGGGVSKFNDLGTRKLPKGGGGGGHGGGGSGGDGDEEDTGGDGGTGSGSGSSSVPNKFTDLGAVTIILVVFIMLAVVLSCYIWDRCKPHQPGVCGTWNYCFSALGSASDAYVTWKRTRRRRSVRVVVANGPFPLLEAEGVPGAVVSEVQVVPDEDSPYLSSGCVTVADMIEEFSPTALTAPVVPVIFRQHAVPVVDGDVPDC